MSGDWPSRVGARRENSALLYDSCFGTGCAKEAKRENKQRAEVKDIQSRVQKFSGRTQHCVKVEAKWG